MKCVYPDVGRDNNRVSYLVIVCESGDCDLSQFTSNDFLYQIGSVRTVGQSLVSINDPYRLNRLAEEIREDYLRWVGEIEAEYDQIPHRIFDTSPVFFSDLSCKRTEIFDTFNTICNVLLLQEKLDEAEINEVHIFNGTVDLECAVVSGFPSSLVCSYNTKRSDVSRTREILSDVRYLARCLFSIAVCGVFWNPRPIGAHTGLGYFSIYPKMTDLDGNDHKYGDQVAYDDIHFYCVLTDGFHQSLTIGSYLRALYRLRDQTRNIILIDSFISIHSVLKGLRLRSVLWRHKKQVERREYLFRNINLTGFVQKEIKVSHQRIWRLSIFAEAFSRAFLFIPLRRLTYYLFEYPIGRLISMAVSVVSPKTIRIGFQHGPASWRKMVYFLGPHFIEKFRFVRHQPLPNRVLAENLQSEEIYRAGGYESVEVMPECSRLAYLKSIKRAKTSKGRLIAPGLNDGANMLSALQVEIASLPDVMFYLRPHPLANNEYLESITSLKNVKRTSSSLPELLSKVGTVYVTYSSVGLEARKLGINIVLVDIPGIVSQSPLHDEE